jgi:hypothetical protein
MIFKALELSAMVREWVSPLIGLRQNLKKSLKIMHATRIFNESVRAVGG